MMEFSVFPVVTPSEQICSRTVNNASIFGEGPSPKPKLIWNVQWMMRGIDVHMSQHIGKKLSALFETLTTLTEDERGAKEEDVYLETVGPVAGGGEETTTATTAIIDLASPQDERHPTPIEEQPQPVTLPSILVEGIPRRKGHKVTISDDPGLNSHPQIRSMSPPDGPKERDTRRKLLESQISEQGENLNTLKQVRVG